MSTTQLITETKGKLTASVVEGKRIAGIISPGQGSCGLYSQEVIEAAAPDKVFPKGTHMYFDHPTLTEDEELPERSVLRLGAVTNEDARWDAELGMLVAGWDPIAKYAELLEDATFLKAIGLSIRATAEVEETDKGRVVVRLVEGKSIDFVTKAGRGGAILNIYESARPSMVNEKAIARGVAEATVNDKREALGNLVREEYSTDKIWVWLRDFDDDVAYFDIESGDDAGTYSQSYDTGEDDMPSALTGARTEVRASTTYVPVHPAGPVPSEESKEDTMAKIQIEESAHTDLLEKAGRVSVLESERDTAVKERDEAKQKLAESDARTAAEKFARKRVSEANSTLPALVVDRIVKESLTDVPLTDKHELDEAKFGEVVDEAKTEQETYLASLAEAAGAGTIQGFGLVKGDGDVSEADFDAEFDTKKEA